jgi:hypothetical protein
LGLLRYDLCHKPIYDIDLLGLGVRSCAQQVGEEAVEAELTGTLTSHRERGGYARERN